MKGMRLRWLFAGLAFITGGMLLGALVFQYAMGLEPCVMCVYQRLGVIGMFVAASWGFLSYRSYWQRITSQFLWLVSAGYTLNQAREHVSSQQNSNPFFSSCEGTPTFPLEIPLDQWVPWLFKANGPCGDIDWSLFGMSMPAWVLFLTATMIIVWVVFVLIFSIKRVTKK